MAEFEKKLNELMGVKEVEDLIEKNGLTKMFNQYCEEHFELNNLPKYLEFDSGIFSFDFLQKIFMTAFVFKCIIHDKTTTDLVKQRQEYLKAENSDGYKSIIKKMQDMEEKIFESTLEVTKKKVQIIPQNFTKTY